MVGMHSELPDMQTILVVWARSLRTARAITNFPLPWTLTRTMEQQASLVISSETFISKTQSTENKGDYQDNHFRAFRELAISSKRVS